MIPHKGNRDTQPLPKRVKKWMILSFVKVKIEIASEPLGIMPNCHFAKQNTKVIHDVNRTRTSYSRISMTRTPLT